MGSRDTGRSLSAMFAMLAAHDNARSRRLQSCTTLMVIHFSRGEAGTSDQNVEG
jgi:hypothetical protein